MGRDKKGDKEIKKKKEKWTIKMNK